mmetsp:Transcript_42375/g.113336  ORF Transcript_42375/g.113336 Transcript_42375/m.113336 type:complete len:356 (+) Transcript_42375:296-1363(+)
MDSETRMEPTNYTSSVTVVPDNVQFQRECSKEESGSAPGRWVHQSVACDLHVEGDRDLQDLGNAAVDNAVSEPRKLDAEVNVGLVETAQTVVRTCDFGDENDQWVWVPAGCSYRRYSPLEAQECLEETGRRVLFAGASPQRTLFYDVAGVLSPGDVITTKSHQDLEYPPAAYFHWVPYHTDHVSGCPLDCQLDYGNVTWHLKRFVDSQSTGPGDLLIVQAGIHDIFFGSLETYKRNIPRLAKVLGKMKREGRIDVMFRFGDAIHLPRGGDISIVERGFRSQRMTVALRYARQVMEAEGVPILDSLQMTLGRPEGTADGYHFNDFAAEGGRYRGNAIARTLAQIVLNRACSLVPRR